MTFNKYIEFTQPFIEDKPRDFQVLCLVSDTTKLLEKLKYFRNESSMITVDIGDLVFSLFAVLQKSDLVYDAEPFDLDAMRMRRDLDKQYQISEENLLQNFVMELGVISNIITENERYDLAQLNESDSKRLKMAIYSFLLQIMILLNKMEFSMDRILDMSVERKKLKNKEIRYKRIDEE